MLSHHTPRHPSWASRGLRVLPVLLLLLGLLPAASAAAALSSGSVSVTAPSVAIDGGEVRFDYSVTTSKSAVVKNLRVQVRPPSGADVGMDTPLLRNVTIQGTRDFTAGQSGLEGSWTAAVAWSADGVRWSIGPVRAFSVPVSSTEPSTTAPATASAEPTPTSTTTSAAPSSSTTPSTTPAPTPEPPSEAGPGRLYGTLRSSTTRLPTTVAAGVSLVTLDVAWKQFEPVEGQVDTTYLSQVRLSLDRFRAAGVEVVLSPGVQYPPTWLLAQPHSRYVNQYGGVYASSETGKKVANMVFNQFMRDRQQNYLGRLFGALGTDFYGVRLGGGWYGELNYPEHTYSGRTNAYWGFDPIATGAVPGLPPGIGPNPVPGWVPGTASVDHDAARRFLDWYLASLDDYHDWQITTARRYYGGRLLMLYPSWGLRPGQVDAAVAADLAGSTSAERNGEVQRGFDVARFIGGVTDPGVVVYTTWLNADASRDGGTDMRYWSPVRYLAHLAAAGRVQPLGVMGENTGRDTVADMQLTFDQARRYRLQALVWAFEPELYGGVYASVDDYAAAIRGDQAG